jgi:hypothetical protein
VTLGPRGVNIPDLNVPGLDLFLSLLSERNQIHFKMSKRKTLFIYCFPGGWRGLGGFNPPQARYGFNPLQSSPKIPKPNNALRDEGCHGLLDSHVELAKRMSYV